ncbi:preprotein translocase subunit YajC [Periweissella fabaria]|uniref:Preprotein translocase subunit YajC n=1 Tax=Periweissella fabaria TaxID=546157 RepID=A0ABM8Z7L7_9LACO|nr:preprotein translocase subunit YajC [Periweissella fabaria]MCM0597788.1 preprotein translocase subunit YajC [Periweissella fabaria]CAH0417237.1 hypothetical protein WFA24289_01569 [Periweissella fabaria]
MGPVNILILVVLIGGMLFMTTRSQKKQRDMRDAMMSKLQKGAHVVTIGRLHGVVDSLNEADKTVTLDCDGIYLVFDTDAIAKVIDQPAVVEATPAETTTPSDVTAEPKSVEESTITEATTEAKEVTTDK